MIVRVLLLLHSNDAAKYPRQINAVTLIECPPDAMHDWKQFIPTKKNE